MDRDIDKRKTAFTTTIDSTSNAENGEIQSVNDKALLSHFEPPKFIIALALHVDYNDNPSDLQRRAASRSALSHISS